jgi:methionyl-tRNA formyltransferase
VAARALRLVFFGTPDFALPTLERLVAGRHPVVLVVSQPDRGRGRGRRPSPAPVSRLALRAGLPLLRPERVGEPEVVEALRACAPDLGVVVAYGQFLPRPVREAPSLGYSINGHASLLPAWRGAAPIPRAILAGESRTGISVMRVEREMDAGPVALVRELEIAPDESAGELGARLALLCADAIAEAVDRIAEGRVEWRPQDPARASFAPRLARSEAELDFREGAPALVRRVRALSPQPGAVTSLAGEPLRILAARAEPGPAGAPAGSARRRPGEPLRIATGDGWLVPLRLQRAGGRPLDVEAYLRGRPIPDGARLGPPTASLSPGRPPGGGRSSPPDEVEA